MLHPRAVLLLSAMLTAAVVEAGVINVSPGSGTLQAAIDAASPGDTLRLVVGTYTGAVTIDKQLQLLGPRYVASGPQGAVIDAGCAAATALSIEANDVYVKRVVVMGGTDYTIDIDGRAGVRLKRRRHPRGLLRLWWGGVRHQCLRQQRGADREVLGDR